MTDQLDVQLVRGTSEPPVEPRIEPSAADYRYPGAPPFADSEMDRLLFCGRAKEIDQVLHSILSFDLFLIYAISGLGKSSLISAGVMEQLRERDFFPVIVRLNNPKSSPVELIDEQLREAASKIDGITVMRNPSAQDVEGTPSSLWDLLTGLEVWKGNTLQHPVLVFDQFEELFTLGWSDEQRSQFIEQFGQVIRRHRTVDPGPGAQRSTVLPPPAVKVVLIIREDFLGELEAMSQQVPQIMRHRFRLDGLAPEQAELAIREPAQVDDPRLSTRRFGYTEGAAQAMLGFLGARQDGGRAVLTRTIDPSQLQIICQHVERSILPTKSLPDAGSMVEITEEDLGGKDGLDRILRDFYRREILSFPSHQRKIVRTLCETGLINQRGRRLSLEEEEIGAKYKVSKATLEDLVARRLLRAEPRVGSIYYELAHDTLAAPILAFHEEARKEKRRRRWRFGLLGAAVVVALVVVFFVAISGDDAAAPAQTITIGTSVSGTIEENSVKTFEFDALADQTLLVELAPGGKDSLDTVQLQVMEPNGFSEIADTSVEGRPQRVVLHQTESGTYGVAVSEFGSNSVDYALSVSLLQETQMPIGETSGTIDSKEPVAAFGFDPPEDQTFMVELTPRPGNTLAAVTLTVTGPNGPIDQSIDNARSRGAERVLLERTVAGTYGVAVNGGSSNDDFNVDFNLTVRPADVATVPIGRTMSGHLGTSNPFGVFEFDPSTGQTVMVKLTPKDGDPADTALLVTDADGITQEADSTGDGQPQTVVLAGAANGPALVVVSGFGSSTLDYELSVSLVDVTKVPIDATTPGTIDSTNPTALFEFEPPDDRTYLVELKSGEGFDAVLQVTDPGGLVDREDIPPDANTEIAVVNGGVKGRYLVEVSGFESQFGAFELLVRAPTITEMAIGDTKSGVIDKNNATAVFAFNATADQALIVDLDPETDLHPMLRVTDPDGFTSEIDNAGEGGPQSLTVDGTSEGRYLIIVSGYGSTTGDFKVSVHST